MTAEIGRVTHCKMKSSCSFSDTYTVYTSLYVKLVDQLAAFNILQLRHPVHVAEVHVPSSILQSIVICTMIEASCTTYVGPDKATHRWKYSPRHMGVSMLCIESLHL